MKVLILGGGNVGLGISRRIDDEDMDVTVVEKDKNRSDELRERNLKVVEGDFCDTSTLIEAGIENTDIVLITTKDLDENLNGLRSVKINNSDTSVAIRTDENIKMEKLKEIMRDNFETDYEVDYIIEPSSSIIENMNKGFKHLKRLKRTKDLTSTLQSFEDKKIGIVAHNDPDPDALASAYALQRIFSTRNIESKIFYSGDISHQENRAMINLLKIEPVKTSDPSELRDEGYTDVALVDFHPGGKTDIIDDEMNIVALIDHHNFQIEDIEKVKHLDIRLDKSSTSSILIEYLKNLNIEIDPDLATSLFYGVYTDTNRFRDVEEDDLYLLSYIKPYIDKDKLSKMESPDISGKTLDVLGKGIMERETIGNVLVSNLGVVRERDALPQAADLLLQLEGVSTTLVFGIIGEKIEMSARTRDVRVDIGTVMKDAFNDLGSGGGRSGSGGAQIPLGIFNYVEEKEELLDYVSGIIRDKFLDSMGIKRE